MAYFGRKTKKPQSKPGAASGGSEEDKLAALRGLERKLSRGRTERSVRSLRTERSAR